MKKNVKVEKMFKGIAEENFTPDDDEIVNCYNRNMLLSNWLSKDEVTVCLGQEPHVWDEMLYIPASCKAFVTLSFCNREFRYDSAEGMVNTGFAFLDREVKKLFVETVEEVIELDLTTGELSTTSKTGMYKYDLQFLGKSVDGLIRHMEKSYLRKYIVGHSISNGTHHRQREFCSWCENYFDIDFEICDKHDYTQVIKKVRTFASCKYDHNRNGRNRFELDTVKGVYLKPISPVFKDCVCQVFFD